MASGLPASSPPVSSWSALLTAVLDSDWPNDVDKVTLVPIDQIGRVLFRDWLLPFEVASIVLLVALIGAVVISSAEEGEA